jgi:DNA/RNA-binding domain of Phe-tRNA-synthetase-like protein
MTLARTGGLSLDVDESLRGVLTFGWLEADGIRDEPLTDAYRAERDEVCAALRGRNAGRSATDVLGVAENRAMFHRLGIDPTKSRPSSEALLRRTLQGKDLPAIHPVVDVCNLASLQFQFPLGLYDRDRVRNAVFARLGRPGEGYDGIRKGRVNLTNRPLLADDDGPFGAPTSDSARTQVTAGTSAVLVVVFCPSERTSADLSAMLGRVTDLLSRHCSATVRIVHTLQ